MCVPFPARLCAHCAKVVAINLNLVLRLLRNSLSRAHVTELRVVALEWEKRMSRECANVKQCVCGRKTRSQSSALSSSLRRRVNQNERAEMIDCRIAWWACERERESSHKATEHNVNSHSRTSLSAPHTYCFFVCAITTPRAARQLINCARASWRRAELPANRWRGAPIQSGRDRVIYCLCVCVRTSR